MENQHDERLGLPSASAFHRLVACPGSHNLWQQIVAQVYGGNLPEQEASPEAARGVRIHLARETGNTLVLQDETETKAYDRGLELEATAMQQWLDEVNPTKVVEGEREARLWLRDEQGNKQLSARLDLHFFGEREGYTHVLCPDWKTGAATGSGKAESNWQGKVTAAILFSMIPGIESVTFSLIKPEAFPNGHYDSFTYDHAALIATESAVRHYLAESQNPDAPRYAGDQCQYCPSKAWCPESAAYSMLPSVVAHVSALDTKAEIQAKVAMLTPADWTFIWKRSSVIKNITDAATSMLKTLDDATLSSLGIRRGNGRTLSEIPGDKTKEACGVLTSIGLPEDEVWKCLSVNKADVISLIARETNCKKSVAEAAYESNLGALVTSKTGEPILRDS